MFTSALVLGSLAALAQGAVLVTRAEIYQCLGSAGVPNDHRGTGDWNTHAAPFNLRVPYTPVAVAVPQTTDQIRKAVLCGKGLGIKVTGRSGGHSYANYGLGGDNAHLVIELSRMSDVSFDKETNVATVQAGARLGHLATVLYEKHGRAVAHGTCPGVGVSGHFAHGGFGFSSHMHGLALDFVVGATVVLASGEIVEASETENTDLFWAIRGAGSNYGIIASWRLRTIEAPTTLTYFGVSLGWKQSTAVAGLSALEQYAKNEMPRELNFRVSDYNRGAPGIEGLYYGTDKQMRAAIEPLLTKAAPKATFSLSKTVNWKEAVTYYAFNETIDWTWPSPQENFYAKSLALKGLNGTSAQNFVDYWFETANKIVNRNWWFQLDMHGGQNSAISQVSNRDTAYAHRDKLFIIQFYDRVPNDAVYPADGFSLLDGWADATTAPLPASDWGKYINYVDANLDQATAQRLYYGVNLPRLQQLKAKYDPEELFWYPQSIKPA
ncbi:FAD binding domain-containing protein [Apiospora arundinis]|uniref:FAD binding domain-containing protein n=1 Tax=Apiospora arundinis TaxID=335852 RepID=A0ABR2I766_9PEZI